MEPQVTTATGRKRLKPRREPYWSRISVGCYVGFRKLAEGDGTWIARWRGSDGKQHYRALGHFAGFDDAAREARKWFDQCNHATPKVVTVQAACEQYVIDRRNRKGVSSANDAEGRFKRHVYGRSFEKIKVGDLKAADVEAWLGGLVRTDDDDPDAERRSKDSANRDLSALKAALNFAFRNGQTASDGAWRRVQSFPNVARRRERFLTIAERRVLVAAASPELKRLISAIALTAARPGEIASASVGDFDETTESLTLDGKTGRRTVPLSPRAVAFFRDCARSKTPAAPLVARDVGSRWHRFAWRDAIREAVEAAKLPRDVVLYSVRHAAISEMLVSGIDPLSVARLCGTSVAMIQRHYGHLVHDHVRARLARVRLL